jgi:hypothetical protein
MAVKSFITLAPCRSFSQNFGTFSFFSTKIFVSSISEILAKFVAEDTISSFALPLISLKDSLKV